MLVSGVGEDERGCLPFGTGMDGVVEGPPRAMDEWDCKDGVKLLLRRAISACNSQTRFWSATLSSCCCLFEAAVELSASAFFAREFACSNAISRFARKSCSCRNS